MPNTKTTEPRNWSREAISNALMILRESRYWDTIPREEDRVIARAKEKHEKHILACYNLFGVSYKHEAMKETREYISHIGGISKKKKKDKTEKKTIQKIEEKPPILPPKREKNEGFILSKDVLDDIAEGAVKVPANARQDQLQAIREYITRRIGFNPEKILLGIDSHMLN
ncbi:MAG: hypothetical protein WCT07_02235 [Candidatus Paceibacterota bacterium]|jgi:hypothetical protein